MNVYSYKIKIIYTLNYKEINIKKKESFLLKIK